MELNAAPAADPIAAILDQLAAHAERIRWGRGGVGFGGPAWRRGRAGRVAVRARAGAAVVEADRPGPG